MSIGDLIVLVDPKPPRKATKTLFTKSVLCENNIKLICFQIGAAVRLHFFIAEADGLMVQ